MTALSSRLRTIAVGAGAVALVVVGAGGVFAASNPSTLYACYDVYGNVRMGDSAQCKLPGGGRLVSWGTVGPTGATGPTGPTGATGPAAPVARHSGTVAFAQQFIIPGSGQDNTFFLFICGFVAQLTGLDSHIWTPAGTSVPVAGFGVSTLPLPGTVTVLTAVTSGVSGKAYAWDAIIFQPVPGGPCSFDFVGSY